MSTLAWVILIVVIVAVLIGALVALQLRRRRSGVIVSGKRGPR